MKQHITPKQAKQLTETQFYSLFDEIVPRADWANYHHKKVTIGKLIEVLGDVTITQAHKGSQWDVTSSNRQQFNYLETELVDALWNAVVDAITSPERSHPL